MNPSINKLSRRTWLRLASGASAATLTGTLSRALGQTPQGGGQDHVSGAMFTNPLFAGEYADPTILRVGADFYITHTPCAHAPALLIWHSRDLVNWTPIANAVKKTLGTIYASDLSEHQGRYFIYLPLEGHLSVIHAEHPGGPWSEPIDLGVKGNDPSHVVGPDGKRYMHFDWGRAVELSADGLSVVGQPQTVYKGWDFPKEWKTEGNWLEGPKLTRRGDYYYLVCAEGGTAGPPTSHMVVVARSRSPLGPWENSPHNPLIHTYSADEEWWSVGHGTLFSTPDDRWYLVYHGYRKDFRTLGRQTLLEPVEWTDDGWPHAPLGARRAEPMPAPMGVAQKPMIELSDDFKEPVLRATWSAWQETDMSRFRVGGGALTMEAKGGSFAEGSPLMVSARDESYEVEVVATPESGAVAAFGLMYKPDVALFVEIGKGQMRVGERQNTLDNRQWGAGAAHLKITNRRNRVELSASEDGDHWHSLVADIDVSGFNHNELGGYQALRPTLGANGKGSVRSADFRYRKL